MDTPIPKHSEADESYHHLHQAIIQGELLPNQRLVEMDLAEKFGVGRAAIRTALDRLERDGLIEHEPNRGAHVRAVSLEEAVEMLEARAVLEGFAARYAAIHVTPDDMVLLQTALQEMERCLAAGDLLGVSDANAQLHAHLLRIANHRTVTKLLERLQAQHVRFQYRMILVPGRAAHSIQEHRAILDAIIAKDADAAETAMRAHLTQSANTLRQSAYSGTQRQIFV